MHTLLPADSRGVETGLMATSLRAGIQDSQKLSFLFIVNGPKSSVVLYEENTSSLCPKNSGSPPLLT